MAAELVIFDCDGVLVDTEPVHNRAWLEPLRGVGLDWSLEETMRRLIGRSMRSCVEIVEREAGRPVPADFLDDVDRRTEELFAREGLRAIPGIADALDALADRPNCVASSGDVPKIRRSLGMTGLLGRFEGRIFSASMVARGKPAPDLFLFAARRMGVDPQRCVVVEDSLAGTQAGVAAGMRVLSYAAPYSDHAALEAAGGELFADMRALPALVG